MSLTFLHPHFLYALLLLPILLLGYVLFLKKRRESALAFSKVGLLKKAAEKKRFSVRKHITFVLLFVIVMSLVLALADPHLPLEQEKEGVNVVLALDVSGSMQATDYKPNRIESAKVSAKTLIEQLEPMDHVGIVVFETGATTASYLTQMKDRVIDKLSSITAKDGRTAIGDGLALAIDMVTSIPNKKKLVILLSDGVHNSGVISVGEAIQFARDNEIQVYTIGMGSDAPTVIGYDFFGRPQYAELDESTLKQIAKETGGDYYRAVDDKTLQDIYEGLSEKIEREKEPTSIKDWFIGLALILLIIELYLRYGKLRILQ
ncbi:VWA domain-containing protein [Candidatus Woesearchaeota archaeon]|nr:VWA domain-containing protein [Candidatus Woesearchaeota archaeon]